MADDARRCVIAIDAGTTGVRSRAIFADGGGSTAAYDEFTQIYPQPGWVEHDADEIWSVARSTFNDVVGRAGRDSIAALGITNQRETVVAWNRRTGRPYGTAIVWQTAAPDRASRCEPADICRWCAIPGSCSTLLLRVEVRVVVDQSRDTGRRRARARHNRLVADLEPHGGRRARHRRDQRQ